MQEKYNPQQVEADAQAHWRATDAYRAVENDLRFPRGKFYVCSMLPYPSGKLHMGHVRNYTLNDVMYRYMRSSGYNVMTPMGWDAFGLPAENAAIEKKIAPAKWTRDNIADMKSQMQPLGLAFDWSREVATCDASYYKWNQWLFLKMLEKGIAYRKTQIVNWDPVDNTVLANEQVIDGRGWRSNAIVEKREIPGYYLAITKYADELLDCVRNDLEGWPPQVRTMQENWIGKSTGVNFGFRYDLYDSASWRHEPPLPFKGAEAGIRAAPLRAAGAASAYEHETGQAGGGDGDRSFAPSALEPPLPFKGRGGGGDGFPRTGSKPHPHPNPPLEGEGAVGAGNELPAKGLLRVFTTRADTIMGVTFMAIAAEHPLAALLARDNPRLAAFVDECKHGGVSEADLATMEKKGMATGFFVSHPLTNEKVEVWVGNYVLMGYGEGAVMGVPAHDERDFAFAKKYGLPIPQVIAVPGETFSVDGWQEWYADKQRGVCVNSGRYDGLGYEAATDAIAADLKAKGLGDKQVQYRLRDWGISRQRYWGTPIPIIHCAACGPVPVLEKDLPVVLPEHHIPDGSGNPLNKDETFLKCSCPNCGKPARRETDTMDTFVDSSWYYMRYCCTPPAGGGSGSPDADTMVDARVDYWMPMDQYIGGIEHAVLHLLYARFWTKVMRDLGLVKFDEPFSRLFTQGMLLNDCYFREEESGRTRWFYPNEVDVSFDERGRPAGAIAKEDGRPVLLGGIEKMSKSKNNVVEPRDIIARFGADTARAFVMFAGPPDMSAAWSDSGAEGVYRFLRRLWTFCHARRGLITSAPSMDGVRLSPSQKDSRREVHLALKQALFDYQRMQYNTVVSATMKMLNALDEVPPHGEGNDALVREGLSLLLRTLYPIAPHITHALWTELGFAKAHGALLDVALPQPDQRALAQDEIELVVQVNGKLRGAIRVPAQADKATIEAAAMADANVQKFVAGCPVKRVVVVPNKLVNVVV